MTGARLKVLWYWHTMGPYHFARMCAVAKIPGIELTVVECTHWDDHGWTRRENAKDLHLITLSKEPLSGQLMRETRHTLTRLLRDVQPDVVVGCGYADKHSLQAIFEYRHFKPECLVLLWSESTAIDHPRTYLKESLKSLLVSVYDGALVAGSSHASYLRRLGMPATGIKIVGNCVDNDFFSVRADSVRLAHGVPDMASASNSFLYVGRLIPEKNVSGLIEAYREYRQRVGSGAWELVLVGSGPEESALRSQVLTNKITGIRFVGLCQLEDLPNYYGNAGCFVLPSIREPWGLVVNEAMASGLPVLVSNRCGCASELVQDKRNGFVFDPFDGSALVELLVTISHGNLSLRELGMAGRAAVAEYSPSLFAQRTASHIRLLMERHGKARDSRLTPRIVTGIALRGLAAMAAFGEWLPAENGRPVSASGEHVFKKSKQYSDS